MFFTADQLVAHAVGDYLLQSHWMATTKTKQWLPAVLHVLLYGLPFLLLTRSPAALAVIVLTHLVIDHWRLARYVVWVKNFLAPGQTQMMPHDVLIYGSTNPSWSECSDTGFPPDTPPYIAFWLLIIVDNLMHVLINGAALHWLG